jgi:hypothetical protein
MRPTTVQEIRTKNIKDTGYFTVNHTTADMIEAAHHTSANYELEFLSLTKQH